MLTCKELTEVVSDYLEGRMSLVDRVRFQLHVGMCRHCRAYLRQMRTTVRTLGKLPVEPVSPALRDELLVRFRGMRPVGVAVERPGAVARFDRSLGNARGWAIVGVLLFLAAVLSLLLGGESGPVLGAWQACLLVEAGASVLVLVGTGIAVFRGRGRLSAGALAAVGAGGAMLAFLATSAGCPHPPVTAHVLIVHAGGVLLGALIGAASSRLPIFRGALT